jgi:hypothetical protein
LEDTIEFTRLRLPLAGRSQALARRSAIRSFHTLSRDASNTPVIVIPPSLASPPLGGSAILGSILARSQALTQTVEAFLPKATVRLEPFGRDLQRRPA